MWGKIVKFKTVSLLCLIGVVFIAGGTLWAYYALRGASGLLIVHHNNIQAINNVGRAEDVVKIGMTGLVAAILDFFIALELETRDKILGKVVAAACLFSGILIFIGFAAIISVN